MFWTKLNLLGIVHKIWAPLENASPPLASQAAYGPVAKSYENIIEKFKFTSIVNNVVSDNTSSIIKAFQISLPEFILHKTAMELLGTKKSSCSLILFQNKTVDVEDGTDLSVLTAFLPESVICFNHTKQLCIKNCLQDPKFSKSYVGKQFAEVVNIVNSAKNVNVTPYLQRKKIILKSK